MRNTFEEKFWAKVDKAGPDECWPWTGSRAVNRHGVFTYGRTRSLEGGRYTSAQRVAYALVKGPVPREMVVCHTCDNPPCCNPSHLWLGTVRENNVDRKRKGRSRGHGMKGETHGSARITEAQARDIIARSRRGEPDKALAPLFGISVSAVYRLRTGRQWAHLFATQKLEG